MIKTLILKIYYSIVYYIPCLVRELLLRQTGKNSIVVHSFLDLRFGCWHIQNWGDDINVFLCKEWFNKGVICFGTSIISSILHRRNYCLIGSMLQNANRNTIVWGTGLISEDILPKECPLEIRAVRGPLTRQRLVENGYDCPEVYGDPVLLLSKYYKPTLNKKYKLGIIAHIHDENNKLIAEYVSSHTDTIFISLSKYKSWRDVVDRVCECDRIISSSLHGLILADTYNIPNQWVEFSKEVFGNGFKFYDYFASVKRDVKYPISIFNIEDFDLTISQMDSYIPADIDLDSLIKSCPFKIPFS